MKRTHAQSQSGSNPASPTRLSQNDNLSGDDNAVTDGNDTPQAYRQQDIYLPINNISKIMRQAVPSNGKVAKEAKECVQECVSEFISFITSEAAERCALEKRKTINGEDILFAMHHLGFDPYIEPLTQYLKLIRHAQNTRTLDTSSPEKRLRCDNLNSSTETDHRSQSPTHPNTDQILNDIGPNPEPP